MPSTDDSSTVVYHANFVQTRPCWWCGHLVNASEVARALLPHSHVAQCVQLLTEFSYWCSEVTTAQNTIVELWAKDSQIDRSQHH